MLKEQVFLVFALLTFLGLWLFVLYRSLLFIIVG
jgi:hypothetical protein